VPFLPDDAFEGCYSLASLNLDASHVLTCIPEGSLMGCRSLSKVQLPKACRRADLFDCGVRELDLRHGRVPLTYLGIECCGLLKRLILPRDFAGVLEARCNVALRSLTCGSMGVHDAGQWADHVRLCFVRCESFIFKGRHGVATSCATVFGELGAFSCRAGRPALPL
jgi:hypothetical protein